MIYSMDENLGRLFKYLKENNLYDNTIIIFTSDNGGLATSEGTPTTNFPLRAGKGWLYEGGLRIPMIIKTPEMNGQNIEIDAPVSHIDLFPTILEATGVNPTKYDIDGRSFLPLLKSGKQSEKPIFWHYPHYSNQGGFPGSAVRLGNYKLIDNFDSGKQELYDLQTDISEGKDISASNPQKTKELYELLKKWRTTTNPIRRGMGNKAF